jgi:hypothetical protein
LTVYKPVNSKLVEGTFEEAPEYLFIPLSPLSNSEELISSIPTSQETNNLLISSSINYTPDMMPSCGFKAVPAKFKGSHEDVKKFLKKFNQMCKVYNVPKDQDKCEHILDYCSSKVVKLFEALPSYKDQDWTRLEKDILCYYNTELRETRYKVYNICSLTQKWRYKRIKDLTQWKKYLCEFMTIAGWLLHKN